MMDLSDLIARVEKASGPDRESDALIAKALLSETHPRLDPAERLCVKGDLSQPLCIHRPEPMRAEMRRRKEAEGAEVLELQDERGWWLFVSRCVPPVTASLGAALALVERVLPRAHKAVGTVPPGGWQDAAPGDWYASVGVDWTLRRYGAAKTAAIALILALLRALEADDEA